jgi:methyl-accepting chemotaxis protein
MKTPAGSSVNKTTASLSPNVQAALADLCVNLLPIWSKQLATSRLQSQKAVGQLLAAFNALSPALQTLVDTKGTNSEPLRAHIEQMFVGLQFQDRLDQMLVLLQHDISRLHGLVKQDQPDPAELSVSDWLMRLESQYVMAEQRHDHGPTMPNDRPNPNIEVSFF